MIPKIVRLLPEPGASLIKKKVEKTIFVSTNFKLGYSLCQNNVVKIDN